MPRNFNGPITKITKKACRTCNEIIRSAASRHIFLQTWTHFRFAQQPYIPYIPLHLHYTSPISLTMCIGSNSPAITRTLCRTKSCLKDPDSSSSDSSLNETSMKRSVSFHSVEINEFPMILGDNPDCSGIPVQIGWQPHNVEKFSLDIYEEMKPKPRKRPDLVLTPAQRKKIVAGTPTNEINSVLEETNQIKICRRYSVQCMKQDNWDYKMERFERKMKKVFTLSFRKSQKDKSKHSHSKSKLMA